MSGEGIGQRRRARARTHNRRLKPQSSERLYRDRRPQTVDVTKINGHSPPVPYTSAFSSVCNFSLISANSLAGSEPATIPAPAYSLALQPSISAERMPTINSLLPSVSIQPKGAVYSPRLNRSCCRINSQARCGGTPATAGVGCSLAKTSNGWTLCGLLRAALIGVCKCCTCKSRSS